MTDGAALRGHSRDDPLDPLFAEYDPGVEEWHLDPDEGIELAVLRGLDADPAFVDRAVARLREVLAETAGDEAALRHHMPRWTGLPAGGTYARWCRYLLELLPEIAARPDLFLDRDTPERIRPARTSMFTDLATANAATTQVLRVHETPLRRWAADAGGTWRLHLYADVGRVVGTSRPNDAHGRPCGLSAPVSACVVVMRRDHRTGSPYVATSHPEVSLPARPRETYPDLPLLFGGYFGQDHPTLDGFLWAAELNLNRSLAPPVRDRIIAQTADLLADHEPDDARGAPGLRATVDALGGYVHPVRMRRWVAGLHRRMTRLDWSPPASEV